MTAVAAVWRSRNVLGLLVRRDLNVKYQQSVLGYLWSLLEPLTVAATYWFVFGLVYDTKVAPDGGGSYILFLASGLFAWIWVNAVLSGATTALTSQARLITTIRVPREVFPIGRVFGKFFEYVAALPVLLVIAIATRAEFGWSLLVLPLAIAVQGLFLVGVALILASTNVMLRDVERFVGLAQRVLFYGVPIIYPLHKVIDMERLPDWVKVVYQANPLVGIFQLHHAAWFPREFPPPPLLASSVGTSVLVFLIGWWVFHRLEPAVLKEL
jgi:ABC-2 type transport system permease protein